MGAPYTAGLFGLGPWGVPPLPAGSSAKSISGAAGAVIEAHAVALSTGAQLGRVAIPISGAAGAVIEAHAVALNSGAFIGPRPPRARGGAVAAWWFDPLISEFMLLLECCDENGEDDAVS